MLVLLLCFVCSGLGSGLVSTPWQHYENHFLDASGNCGGLSGGLGGSFGGLEDTGYYSCAPPIPAAIPANKWFECGPADQAVPPIGRHKCTSPTEIAMSETSLLSGCQNSATGLGPVDFNFFQMYLQVASNAIFSNLTLNTNADDGYRVTIFNSDNLNGCYLPNLGSFQLAGVQSNFKPCIKNGEVNRVVFTQMDTCVVANSIGSAVFLADGVVIPSTLVFDPEATTTGAATTIASTVLSTAASTTLVATTVVPTSAVLSTTSVVPPLTTSSPTSTRPSTFRPSTVLPTTTASPALSSARLLFPELCPFPSVLDYCGFCSTGPPHVCECTSELQLMNACIMCDNNSTAINTGLRLCVPNDAGVTGLPGQYMIFDVEIELVMFAFSTIPNVTFPGQLDPAGKLLDCLCNPRGPCDCPNPNQSVDVCGVCSSPSNAGANCTCTPAQVAAGLCVSCPASTAASGTVRLCHQVVPGVYELVEVGRCNVQDQFARFPSTVFPGFFGVDAFGRPLALDCFCLPPTTTSTTTSTSTLTTLTSSPVLTSTSGTLPATTSSIVPSTTPVPGYCLNVTLPCDGVGAGPSSRADTNGAYCIPTANSTLFLRIGCNEFGTSFVTYSCPFGCDNVCFPDDSINTSLNLTRFDGLLGGPGFCAQPGLFPLLPLAAQMRCVPGICPVIVSTIAFTTTASTTSQTLTSTTLSSTATTTEGTTTSSIVSTTTAEPNSTTVFVVTTVGSSTEAPTTTTTTTTTTITSTTQVPTSSPAVFGCLSLQENCVGASAVNVSTGAYCSTISLPQQKYSFRLSCTANSQLLVSLCSVDDCNRNCTSSPTILALLGLDNVNSGAGVCTTTNFPIPGLLSRVVALQCLASCFTTVPTTSTSTATPTTTPAPPILPPVNQVPPIIVLPELPAGGSTGGAGGAVEQPNDQTDLLAIVGIPTAIFALSILFFVSNQDPQPTPKYYPQRI